MVVVLDIILMLKSFYFGCFFYQFSIRIPPEVKIQMIKKADIILAAALIIIGIAMSYILSFGQDTGSELIISCDGEKFGSYSLFEDREIEIEQNDHINKVTINNGVVSFTCAIISVAFGPIKHITSN